GNLYYASNQDDRALMCFERLLKGNSHNVVVMTMTGNLYRRRMEYDRAIENYRNALEIEPDNSFALFGMGDSFRGHKDMEQAVFWWQKILQHEPRNQALRSRVGDAQILLGRLDEAVVNFNQCLSQSDDIFSYIGLAHVERERGNFQAAIEFCKKALQVDSTHPRILNELAAMQEAAGDHEAAQATRDLITN
ncbi:MAG: tetratricopeptide repeat protein, partial [Gammaproteobacteria bacterium]